MRPGLRGTPRVEGNFEDCVAHGPRVGVLLVTVESGFDASLTQDVFASVRFAQANSRVRGGEGLKADVARILVACIDGAGAFDHEVSS